MGQAGVVNHLTLFSQKIKKILYENGSEKGFMIE